MEVGDGDGSSVYASDLKNLKYSKHLMSDGGGELTPDNQHQSQSRQSTR